MDKNNILLNLQMIDEWLLPEIEVARRNKLITESKSKFINYLKPKSIITFLDFLANLKPIKDEMLEDFIAGLVLMQYANNQEHFNIVDELLEPVSKVIKRYLNDPRIQDRHILKYIPENEELKAVNQGI